ncbi:MAG: hypothetical protein QUV20_15520 [Oceanibaculum nanhaiense]|uniref:nucleoside-diphosphate sugar epimerase/dehydratase n=1 Tax=Oceanibaculum nanhaiense TaxID=1909734 RepID=UPI0025A328D9|nr:hypothetical protein [Oceanibaculum nanhaiense]MDM7947735.1 hypothetical protein [Oceanibaculum nanhaiense]
MLEKLGIPGGSRLVIYGAGSSGRHTAARLAKDYPLVAFADSDTAKQGTVLDGLPVVALESLPAESYDVVIIASMYAEEIAAQLTGALGLPESRIRTLPKHLLKSLRPLPQRAMLTTDHFDAVFDVLEACGVRYFADHSFLLGLVRTGGFIPWEVELDLAVVGGPEGSLERANDILARDFDFDVFRYKNPTELWTTDDIMMVKSASQLCDLHVKLVHEDSVYWCVGPILLKFPAHYYAGVDYLEWNGRRIPVPLNPEAYLAEMYGDWRTPNPNWRYTDYGNIEKIFPDGFVR